MQDGQETLVQTLSDSLSQRFSKAKSAPFKGVLAAGALLALVSGGVPRADAQHYSVTIVTPPSIPFVTPIVFDAADMNNSGVVTGTFGNNIYRAFAWSANNGPFALPFDLPFNFFDSTGRGVSDTGDFVGKDGYGRPCVYHSATFTQNFLRTGTVPVPGLPGLSNPYYGDGEAYAATSSTGFIVGEATPVKFGDSFASAPNHAYAWTPGGDFIDMGPGPNNNVSRARSINIYNHVAGEDSSGSYQDIHDVTRILQAAFVQNVGFVGGLPVASGRAHLPGLGGDQSKVRQINDSDLVVGASQTADGIFHACLWDTNAPVIATVTDLDPTGSAASFANSINSAGVVVGQSLTTGKGFIWDNVHGRRDLNAMLPAGWTCYNAIKINDSGQILAYCYFNGTLNTVVLTLQPTPTLSSLSPSSVPGATAVPTFTVSGTNFTAFSKIHLHQTFGFNGVLDQDMPTTFNSSTQLHTSIPANLLAHAADVTVTVLDPVRGPTNSQNLTVTSGLIPTLVSLTPDTVPVGAAIQTLTVMGTNFKPTSKIHLYQITGFNGSDFTFTDQDLPTTYDSTNQLHTAIPSNLLSLYSGGYITVIDPVLGTGPGLTLNVVGVPKISISSVVATRTGGPGSPLSVLINFANSGTADANNATVDVPSKLKLGGISTTTGTPFTISSIYNGQGILITFPGSILPGNRVLNLTMAYDGGSFSASKLVAVP